ncbi:hypothetical protein OG607_21065 [Streptomyces sp. NBC_01537]|uniref:hypothetical protein n=1 Tax=Streptomyces sp. NBC_01537 TaxID=2903896 RepID=UPI003864A5B9
MRTSAAPVPGSVESHRLPPEAHVAHREPGAAGPDARTTGLNPLPVGFARI